MLRFVLMPANRCDTVGVAPLIRGVECDAMRAPSRDICCANTLTGNGQGVRQQLDHRGYERAKIVISQRPQRLQPLDIDDKMYKWRHLIETYFQKLKEFKRIAMRPDKTDTSYAALTNLCAAIINSK